MLGYVSPATWFQVAKKGGKRLRAAFFGSLHVQNDAPFRNALHYATQMSYRLGNFPIHELTNQALVRGTNQFWRYSPVCIATCKCPSLARSVIEKMQEHSFIRITLI